MASCVKYAGRAMLERRVRGSIVCKGSVAASRGGLKCANYSMSKHAVVGLVRSASLQLGLHGIRVNCVSPYGVVTGMTIEDQKGKSVEEIESMFEPNMSLKGITMKEKHVAEAVLFLACNDSELITGHNLVVDSGHLSR